MPAGFYSDKYSAFNSLLDYIFRTFLVTNVVRRVVLETTDVVEWTVCMATSV